MDILILSRFVTVSAFAPWGKSATLIQLFYNKMFLDGQSNASIKKAHIVLTQSLEHAVFTGVLDKNPCRFTKVPKTVVRQSFALTPAEQAAFIEASTATSYGLFFVFLLYTGLRFGECAALTWYDVDLKREVIKVSKTFSVVKNRETLTPSRKVIISSPKTMSGVRAVPMNAAAKKILGYQQLCVSSGNWVFTNKAGNPFTYHNTRRALFSVLARAKLPPEVTIHTLRHTFATRLLEKGVNIKVISDLLGHSSIQVTLDIYSHVSPQLKKDAVALLD